MKNWFAKQLLSLDTKRERVIALSFLVIVLVSVSTMLIYDHRMRTDYRQERAYGFERRHENAYSSLYLFTRQVQVMYNQQLLDHDLNHWLRNPGILKDDMYSLSILQKSFVGQIQSNSGLDSIYLYNEKIDRILSTSFMISALNVFPHKEVFEAYYESNKSSLWVMTPVGSNGRLAGKELITFVAGIPNRLPAQSGVIALNFDLNYIREEVLENSHSVLWLDADNHVIMADDASNLEFYHANAEPLLGTQQSSFLYKDRFVIRSESPDGSWKLMTIIPEAELMPNRSQNGTLMIVVLTGVLMAALPYLYFYYSKRLRDRWFQTKVESNLPDLQTGFIHDLLNGKPLVDPFEKAKEYQMHLNNAAYQVVVFQIDDYYNRLMLQPHHERLLMNKVIFNAIKWTFKLKFNSYIINTEYAKITVLIGYEQQSPDPERTARLTETIRYIQQDIESHYELTVCAGISEWVHDITKIQDAYVHALLALDYKTVYGKNSIIDYEQLPESEGESVLQAIQFNEHAEALAEHLNEGSLERIEQTVDAMIQDLMGSGPAALDWLHALFSNILSKVMKFALEQRIDIYKQYKEEDLFFTLYSYEFIEDKKQYLLEICEYVVEQLNTDSGKKNGTVEWLIEYIDKHYDQPISLGILADKLAMSSSYLSALIKNHLGIGFVEYISQLRIQKAVRLLENDALTIQEIAEQCGYDTIHTFIRQFKKVHRAPPNEYRKMQRRGQEKM